MHAAPPESGPAWNEDPLAGGELRGPPFEYKYQRIYIFSCFEAGPTLTYGADGDLPIRAPDQALSRLHYDRAIGTGTMPKGGFIRGS